jgi:hypothetical protein
MDRRYSYDENPVWEEATKAAGAAVARAREAIAQECERLGIPKQFAPSIDCHWYGRGRNAAKNERAEMRRVAQREVDAIEKAARTAIERQSVDTQEKIMVGALTTDAARAFLEAMPTAESLMPSLTLEHVETLLITEKSS